jgi:D-glycero-D-manno-heptose 1,7-bisphosphate phosphatase
MTETRAVFVDRDGVINRAFVRNGLPYPPASLDEFEILPGVAEAILQLKKAGFAVIVATNQPDVAKGIQRREVIEAMHSCILKELAIDEVKVCWELDSVDGTYYKPKPGMLLAAAKERAINLTRSYMVGDRWRDVGAGKAAGCFTIFIDRGYAEPLRETPDATCADLGEAAAIILRHASQIVM